MKRSPASSAPRTSTESPRWIQRAFIGCFALYIAAGFFPSRVSTSFDLRAFSQLPALSGGRIKPLDTVARTSLLIISGRQTWRTADGASRPAIAWLADVMFAPEKTRAIPIFEIDDPDVLGVLGLEQTAQRRRSFADLEPKLDEIDRQAAQAAAVKSEQRTRFQSAVIHLQNQLNLYQKLLNTVQVAGTPSVADSLKHFESNIVPALEAHLNSPHRATELIGPLMQEVERYRFLDHVAEFYPLPPLHRWMKDPWISFGSGVMNRFRADTYHPGVTAYAAMADAWRSGDAFAFNEALRTYNGWLANIVPRDQIRARCETVFNQCEPFYRSLLIYVVVFLLIFTSWLVWPRTLNRTAFSLLLMAFALHTTGLVARMILQGRPPVTNLYSSAIFVGWVAVLLGIVLERLYRNGIGSLVSSVIGFLTLIIAQHLASSGDTLEMMRAVLDSNFWLATHVVCITVGYGSTFLSGFLATLYILRERFDRRWESTAATSLERMVYGIVCFSTFFSFLGTILGGIWADQSWGRFWGWDPKENGALMIVLWNVIILHARWGGFAKRRVLMTMAVFGNIVTAFSWFGVNMLGIGLHSYGFMDKAFVWLVVFAVSQLGIMSLAFLSSPKIKP